MTRAARAFMLGALLLLASAGARTAERPPGHAVASAHPLATRAGLELLAAGGNAFDAAVAVSAAIAVVEPAGSGIGGGGFWLLHRAGDGFEVFVDGRETAPAASTPGMYLDAAGKADPSRSRFGALAAGIPGAPAAWVHLSRRYGKRPLAEALAPAIRYARDGFAADTRMARMLGWAGPRLSPAAAAVFLPGGQPPAEGALIRQPDLAATLEQLARHGHDGFYKGPVAQRLVAGVRAAGGIWSAGDLQGYKVIERRPVEFHFRDYRIVTAPPPSAGGVGLAQALQMLESLAWPPASPATAKHLVVEALRRVYRERTRALGDPDFVAIPMPRLLSRAHALHLARDLRRDAASPSEPAPPGAGGTSTTHFSVIDADGNRAAGTLSINLPFGSGLMPEGTGVLLNDEMDDFAASPVASNAYGLAGSVANAVAPGKRPLSSMTPTFVEGPRGTLILGTPGGSRIVSMVLLGVLGFTEGLDAAQVVGLPRYHHQHQPDVIEAEPGALPDPERAALERLGHRIEQLRSPYGNMQAVWWDVRGGRLQAASDPRGIGEASVVLVPAREAPPVPAGSPTR